MTSPVDRYARPVDRILAALAERDMDAEPVDLITWRFECPHHRGGAKTLTVFDVDGPDDRPLCRLDCSAGCTEHEVVTALGLRDADLRERPKANPDPRRPRATPPPGRVLSFTQAATIRPEPTRWLWTDRVPLGAVSLLAGRQGLGKSTLIADLAARASRGQLDGDLHGQPAAVLLVSFEDNAASTIVPRLMAANADLERVRVVTVNLDDGPDLVSLPGDIDAIAAGAHEHGARLIAIDPVVASLPAQIDAHRDQDVRRALAPLARLAEDGDLAVLGSIHFNKSAGADVITRASGSIGFTAAARSVLAFGGDPDDPDGEHGPGRVLAHAKSNLGPLAPSLACRIESREVPTENAIIGTSRLVVTGEHTASASDLLVTRSDDERSEVDEARAFLRDELADGAKAADEIKRAARDAGVSEATLRRAKRVDQVKSVKSTFTGGWLWKLPHEGDQPPLTAGEAEAMITLADRPSQQAKPASDPAAQARRRSTHGTEHLRGFSVPAQDLRTGTPTLEDSLDELAAAFPGSRWVDVAEVQR